MKIQLVSIFIVIATTAAFGAILDVPLNYSTIQNAINVSNNYDTILVHPGDYYERLYVSHPLSLFGIYPFINDTSFILQTKIILPALPHLNDSASILKVSNVDSICINGLSFLGGHGTLRDSILFGGAIFGESSILNLTNCRFKNNSADVGGAIFLFGCQITIFDCIFDSNYANCTGAIGTIYGNRFILRRSNFTNNRAVDFEGAVHAEINQNMPNVIDSCRFENNTSSSFVGAVFTSGNYITNCYFANNSAHVGGAVYLSTTTNQLPFEISHNIFDDNYVIRDSVMLGGFGSALAIQGSVNSFQVNVEHNLFINNQAIGSRGTIYQQNGYVYLRNNQFINNSAVNGSVYYANINAKTFLDSNVFIQNRANYGTFLLSQSCSVYAHNNDFYQNGNWLLSLGGGAHYVVADNNYWGHPSGPWAVTNPNGQGDSVNTGVLYIPFRTTPVFPELPVRDFGDGSERGQNGSGLPNTITIEKVYPNPSNSTLTVHYTINKPQLVSIRLYDTNGREVYSSLPQPQIAGSHTFSLQTDGIASGLYFLKLSSPTSPTESAMQKVVLLK